MDIETHVRELGPVKSAADLAAGVLQLPEDVWLENTYRQKTYQVHTDTQSVVLLFCDGVWPEVDIQKREGWPHLADRALPVMQEILQVHYPKGGAILRAMVARLTPHGTISAHVDSHPSFSGGHRIHVPLITNPDVIFQVDGKQVTMHVGNAYEINNQKVHSVYNGGDVARLHFIFDYAPPDEIVAFPKSA